MTMTKLISVGVSACAYLLSATAFVAGATQRIPLEVFASQGNVGTYPIEIGMPFTVGALTNSAQIRVLDAMDAEVPCQVQEMSRYADNSLRAVLLVFMSPISTNTAGAYTIEFGDGVARLAAPITPVTVGQAGNVVTVNSGVLQFQAEPGFGLITNVIADGVGILLNGLDQFIQEVGQTNLVSGVQTDVTIEESGPIRAVILLKGRFGAAPDAYSYRVRIYTYAGTGLLRMQHTVLALDAVKPLSLAGWGLCVPSAYGGAMCGIGGVPVSLPQDGGLLQDAEFKWTWGPLSTE
ncbi:MAG: hypothetical protein PHR35_20005 [Kiritimatiellae bacterium]|nr:hypothetical protein [Kiritimatiellia bacterium]